MASYAPVQLKKFKEDLESLLVERHVLATVADSLKNITGEYEVDFDRHLKKTLLYTVVHSRLSTVENEIQKLTEILLENLDQYKNLTIAELMPSIFNQPPVSTDS